MKRNRYTTSRGNYRSFSDDCIKSWYIIDREGDAIDKRGTGYSRKDALEIARQMNNGVDFGQARYNVVG